MRIVVNGRFLLKPYTGIGQFTKNLLIELTRIDSKNEYVLVTPEKIKEKPEGNAEIVVLPETKFPAAGVRKTWWEQVLFPRFLKKIKADIAFFPYPANPWFGGKKIKVAVTVHDCVPWTEKAYTSGILSKLYHFMTKLSVQKADWIFTVSEASKKEIMKIFGVKSEKIIVVNNAAGKIYSKDFDEKDSVILRRFNLKHVRYFLYVGGYDQRKNVPILLKEYETFVEKYMGKEVVPLVLAGGKLMNSKLYSSFDLVKDENVIKTGFLNEHDLAVLYRNCLGYLNFSGNEGFNIPIIEAAKSGAPLILSDIPVHREVAKDSAIFVNVKNYGEGAFAMQKLLNGKAREEYKSKALELSKNYSWKSSAQKIKNVLFSL